MDSVLALEFMGWINILYFRPGAVVKTNGMMSLSLTFIYLFPFACSRSTNTKMSLFSSAVLERFGVRAHACETQ